MASMNVRHTHIPRGKTSAGGKILPFCLNQVQSWTGQKKEKIVNSFFHW